MFVFVGNLLFQQVPIFDWEEDTICSEDILFDNVFFAVLDSDSNFLYNVGRKRNGYKNVEFN